MRTVWEISLNVKEEKKVIKLQQTRNTQQPITQFVKIKILRWRIKMIKFQLYFMQRCNIMQR